ncbi:MAG: NAD(P)/FAD-dependent oxidoreductase [Dehalococcoidia bacterium]
MGDRCDIAIVGAGAAGLAAGIFAAEATRSARKRIVILDGARTIGAKILVSGGGRCNVTHNQVRAEDFNGSKHIVGNILAAFDERATVRWFESLGVRLKREETGKLFPVSDSARTVLDALLRRCDELGVTILRQHRISSVVPPDRADVREQAGNELRSLFAVRHSRGQLLASHLIMATGGRSLPRTGSDGTGWEIVRRLGHTVTDTYPALVPLVLDERMFHAELSGVSHEAELTTFLAGKPLDRRTGSLLWTHFGVSGPVIMDASRHWIKACATAGAGEQSVELRCNLLPGTSFEQIERSLIDQSGSGPRQSVVKTIAANLPARVAGTLVQHAGIDPTLPLAQLSREARRRLCRMLTGLPLPVLRSRGWNYAEVTAGGVPLKEIDSRTMQSRIVPRLHLIGEMLDCDGRIGGFNFQWAWATGYLAGRAAGPAVTRLSCF